LEAYDNIQQDKYAKLYDCKEMHPFGFHVYRPWLQWIFAGLHEEHEETMPKRAGAQGNQAHE
jgi:hypothetical protein